MAPRRKATPAPAAGEQAAADAAKAGYLIYRLSDGNPITVYRRETPAAVFAFRNGFGMAPLGDGELFEDAIMKQQQKLANGGGPAAAASVKPAVAESSTAAADA